VALERRRLETFIKSGLRRNMSLRIISLALAVALWIFVNSGQRGSAQSFIVPIAYRGLPPHFIITNSHPQNVNIQVVGPETLLSLIDPSRLAVKLDLSGVGVGQASFRIGADAFNVPRQTTVTTIAPSQIVLDIDRIIVRDTPIHPVLRGKTGRGYRVASVEVQPKTVKLRGPSKTVAQIDQIETEPVDLDDAIGSFARTVALPAPAQDLRVDPPEVTANVSIGPIESVRDFRAVPITVKNADYPCTVEPAKINLTLRGPMLALEQLNLTESVAVDADGLTPGDYYLPVAVSVPDGMQLVHQSAEKVRLRIVREKRTARG
jgi:YbbR domain-containing protein